MNHSEATTLLALAAARDNRKPSQAMSLAWHEDLADIPFDIAREALGRHFRTSAEYLMPVHIRQLVTEIRNERAAQTPHEIRQLKSRWEIDEIRDERLRRGIAQCIATLGDPAAPTDTHGIALVRARRERTRPMPMFVKKTGAKPVDLAKIPGPDWDKTEIRERVSVDYLHANNRPCGRLACTIPTCRRNLKEA